MILLLMDCQSLLLVYTLAVTSVFGLLERPMLQAQPGHHHTHSHSNVESSKLGILQCGIVEEYFNSTVCVYVCVWCVCVCGVCVVWCVCVCVVCVCVCVCVWCVYVSEREGGIRPWTAFSGWIVGKSL